MLFQAHVATMRSRTAASKGAWNPSAACVLTGLACSLGKMPTDSFIHLPSYCDAYPTTRLPGNRSHSHSKQHTFPADVPNVGQTCTSEVAHLPSLHCSPTHGFETNCRNRIASIRQAICTRGGDVP